MGAMFCVGACFACGRSFIFNPYKVPSLPAKLTGTGGKEPVCEGCIRLANPRRIANGLPPIEILPGAYDPEPEGEPEGRGGF